MVGYRSIPQWLDSLLKEQFFEPCLIHGEKKEKNFYCFDCNSSVCQSCLFRHRKHILIQVRRYVYHDVLKLSDAQNLMDCSGIQVKHIVATQGSLQSNLCNQTMMGFSDMDECQITPDSVLDSPGSIIYSSGSSANSDLQTALLCTATTEVVRKKRSNLSAQRGLNRVSTCYEPADTHLSRRKRVPNRAPLC
ncbi:hypothetical protein KSS87_005079 [Heliosperma pusillum]|nr:hypothetical protein KSS87_005079 [Heliosperma pusillum]